MLILDRRIINGITNEHSSHCNREDVFNIKAKLKQYKYRTTQTRDVKIYMCFVTQNHRSKNFV